MRIITVANQKGGVGKTTTAINLGTALAAYNENVLIIDLDPQGNASTGLNITQDKRNISSYHVIVNPEVFPKAIVESDIPRLSVIPSTLDLLGAEMEIANLPNRAMHLKNAISNYSLKSINSNAADLADKFDYILIDCPPSLNLLTINALAASQSVLVPLQCEFFALEGLSQLLNTVKEVQSSLNPSLDVLGIVLTMYDSRNRLSDQVVNDVRAYMGEKVFNTIIPRNVRVSEAPSHGKPVLLYDFHCSGSVAYLNLAAELIQREKKYKPAA